MEKRIFIAVMLSLAFLWTWAALAPRFFPDLAKRQAPKPAATSTVTPASNTAPSPATTPAAPPPAPATTSAPTMAAAPAVAPVAAADLRMLVVDNPQYTARFSNRGAQLVSFQLKKYETKAKSKQPVELVKARPANSTDYPFRIATNNAALTHQLNSALYTVEERKLNGGVTELEFRYAGNGVSMTKRFRLGGEYLFDFSTSMNPPRPYRVEIGPGIRTIAADEKDTQFIVTGNPVYQQEGDLEIVGREAKGDPVLVFPSVDYAGIEDNYFLTVLRPQQPSEVVFKRTELVVDAKQKRREYFAGVNAHPNGTLSGNAFFGPKETTILEKYGLEKAMQFGMFGWIARVLLEALLWVNQFTKNYGFAIIVLTIIIKIVLYPLQHKSIVSMKKMQRLQPKMEVIKNRYKKARTDPEQRQKMNTEMMQLYQKEGINPMSGCLPILLQMPILFGFYSLLSRAIELRGADFMLWIQDLSEKDPFYITPILMTITMFIQTWITPATGDPAQRRIFLMMPFIFGFFFKDFPSGLVLYWLVQNILTIIQQSIMNKYWKDHPAELQTA